jgi:hypothetical protein
MPQLIGIVIIAGLVFCIVPVIIQYIVAAVVWVFQMVILPTLTVVPVVIVIMLVAGFFFASWVAARNYFVAVREHVKPESEFLQKVIRINLVGILSISLSGIYVVQLYIFGSIILALGILAVNGAIGYFESIVFPAFAIYYPCK